MAALIHAFNLKQEEDYKRALKIASLLDIYGLDKKQELEDADIWKYEDWYKKWVVRSITESFCKDEYQNKATERRATSTGKCHFVTGIYIDLDFKQPLHDRVVFNWIWYKEFSTVGQTKSISHAHLHRK